MQSSTTLPSPLRSLPALLALAWIALPAAATPEPTRVTVPEDMETASLPARKTAQLATRDQLGVFTGFSFHHERAESGITFEHHIVDDGGLHYKPVHYDHGNGVAVADVDGDGLLDLYFTTQMGDNELWRNTGGGHFENATERAGVALGDRISVAGSFADVDNDGDADLFVTTVKMGNVLFLNDGSGRFTNATESAGLGYVGHSSTGTFFDYDLDGRLDLFVANVGVYTTDERGRGGYYIGADAAFEGHLRPERLEKSLLYENLGNGRFEERSEKLLLRDTGWAGDASPADFDRDGYPDLYVLNMQGDDHYWRNVQGKFFVEQREKLFPKSPWGTMGVKVFDWNNDQLFDLILTDMHSDMSENIGPEREKLKSRMQWSETMLEGGADNIFGNAFWLNTGHGFREVSDQIGTEDYWPWGVSVGDLNADGWEDVVITASMNYPFRYGIDSVLLNDRGERFRDAEFILGVEPRDTMVQPWFTLDCPPLPAGETAESAEKGQPEDFLGAAVKGGGRHPQCQGVEGPVEVMAARGTRSSVLFDLDGDGDLDLVTNEFNGPPQVLVSDLAAMKPIRFLEVELVGSASNRDGLGAEVTVTTLGGTQSQILDGKSGYLSQSRQPLYFGLGDVERVDAVEVSWPSGKRQRIGGPLPVDRALVVEE